MAAQAFDLADIKRRMLGAHGVLKTELAGLRTGRATPSLVEPITVDAYGSMMPLSQVATVAIPEPRLISIQVWDKSVVSAVEKAIRDSNLGLNPNTEGQVIRLRIPDLNEDRRKELVKVAHKYAEAAKVAIRHVRRDGIDLLKKAQKDGHVSEDDTKRHEAEVQKATDTSIADIDAMLAHKEKEILSV
jgi:ribosome recycling factor